MPAAAATRTANPARKPRAVATAAAAAGQAHAFKGLDDWIEVFRAGTHVDSKGRPGTFSAADLDQMVANVGGAGVPAVIGHPKNEDRAFGWAKPGDVRRVGDSLQARLTDVDAEFAKLVDDGAYRERSVFVYQDPAKGWTVRHIGWLGAAAPALTLQPLAYSAPALPDGCELRAFAAACTPGDDERTTAWALGDVAALLRGLREWVISEKGLDAADKVLPDWRITSIADASTTLRELAAAELQAEGGPAQTMYSAGQVAGTHATNDGGTMPAPITQADLDAAVAKAKADALAERESAFSAQAAELAALKRAEQLARLQVQVQTWLTDRVVTPAETVGMAEFMAAVEGGQAGEFAFSAADKSAAKATPAAWFAAFVAGRKALLRAAGQSADPGSDGGAGAGAAGAAGTATDAEIAGRARAYQAQMAAKGTHITMGAAVDAVTAGRDR